MKIDLKAFSGFTLPDTSNEEWVHTSVTPIADISYETAPAHFSVQAPNLPSSVVVSKNKTFTSVHSLDDAFSKLNQSLSKEGFHILVPKNVKVAEPIEITFQVSTNGHPLMVSPRNLVQVEEGGEVTIVERFESNGKNVSFTNSVTQIQAGPNATVRHIKFQNEGFQNFHIGTVSAHQSQNSQFHSIAIHLGGKLVRSNTHTRFENEGGECSMNGFFLTSQDQHTDNHTLIDHAKPHCTSRELYKGILTDRSRAVFDGKIIVRPNAQKTDARQTSRNLLLSENALIDTTPRLEIFADDVKCAHGATIGNLDENALFYFRSRGIDELTAKRILTYAFADEILSQIPQPFLRETISNEVKKRLHEVNR